MFSDYTNLGSNVLLRGCDLFQKKESTKDLANVLHSISSTLEELKENTSLSVTSRVALQELKKLEDSIQEIVETRQKKKTTYSTPRRFVQVFKSSSTAKKEPAESSEVSKEFGKFQSEVARIRILFETRVDAEASVIHDVQVYSEKYCKNIEEDLIRWRSPKPHLRMYTFLSQEMEGHPDISQKLGKRLAAFFFTKSNSERWQDLGSCLTKALGSTLALCLYPNPSDFLQRFYLTAVGSFISNNAQMFAKISSGDSLSKEELQLLSGLLKTMLKHSLATGGFLKNLANSTNAKGDKFLKKLTKIATFFARLPLLANGVFAKQAFNGVMKMLPLEKILQKFKENTIKHAEELRLEFGQESFKYSCRKAEGASDEELSDLRFSLSMLQAELIDIENWGDLFKQIKPSDLKGMLRLFVTTDVLEPSQALITRGVAAYVKFYADVKKEKITVFSEDCPVCNQFLASIEALTPEFAKLLSGILGVFKKPSNGAGAFINEFLNKALEEIEPAPQTLNPGAFTTYLKERLSANEKGDRSLDYKPSEEVIEEEVIHEVAEKSVDASESESSSETQKKRIKKFKQDLIDLPAERHVYNRIIPFLCNVLVEVLKDD